MSGASPWRYRFFTPALDIEQQVPSINWETSYDPILEAVELASRAERDRARGLLADLLAEEPPGCVFGDSGAATKRRRSSPHCCG